MTGKKYVGSSSAALRASSLAAAEFRWNMNGTARIDQDLGRQRIQFDRALALGDRFVEPSLEGQRHAELIVRERVIGVERERPPEFALAASQVVFVEQFEHGERGVRFGGIVVQFDGLLGCRLGLGPRFAWR